MTRLTPRNFVNEFFVLKNVTTSRKRYVWLEEWLYLFKQTTVLKLGESVFGRPELRIQQQTNKKTWLS